MSISYHQWWSLIIKNINDHRDSTCHISAMVTDINVNPNAGCQWSSRLVVDSSCWSSMTIKWFGKWFIMLFLEQIFEIHISATIVDRNINFLVAFYSSQLSLMQAIKFIHCTTFKRILQVILHVVPGTNFWNSYLSNHSR